jgi:hypothetical protein
MKKLKDDNSLLLQMSSRVSIYHDTAGCGLSYLYYISLLSSLEQFRWQISFPRHPKLRLCNAMLA